MTLAFLPMIGDYWHAGHIRILNKALEENKEIIVGILSDNACLQCGETTKHSEKLRLETAQGIAKVSKVILINDLLDPSLILDDIKDIKQIIHGDNWNYGELIELKYFCQSISKSLQAEIIETTYSIDVIDPNKDSEPNTTISLTPGLRLRNIKRNLLQNKPLRVLEAHNPISAIIAEKTSIEKDGQKIGFDAIWSSSLTDSTARWKPDIESVDLTTRVNNLNEIMEVSNLPIIYDGDTGGKVEHFSFMVKTLERIGVSMVIIEDKTGLKRNSLFGTDVEQHQLDPFEFAEKIKEGKKAQITSDFMITTRIESLILKKGLEDAIKRAEIYIDAGADALMIHSKNKDGVEIKEFIKIIRKNYTKIPIVVVPTSYCHIKFDELINYGANVVIYANHMLRAAYPSMVNVANSILKDGCTNSIEKDLLSIPEILNLS